MTVPSTPAFAPAPVFTPTLGILMLRTRFPRPVGDIGNPESFACPVVYRTVEPATPRTVVRGDPSSLLPLFLVAARELVEAGATILSTSCGFLSLFQRELAAAMPVPVVTSALLALAELERPAVLTIEAANLRASHLEAAGASADVPVFGLDETHFSRAIMEDAPTLDVERARAEHVAAALALVRAHPETTDVVLECTNMGPHAGAIEAATGRPVHSIVSLLAARIASQRG